MTALGTYKVGAEGVIAKVAQLVSKEGNQWLLRGAMRNHGDNVYYLAVWDTNGKCITHEGLAYNLVEKIA